MPEKRPTCEDCSLWVRRGAKDKTAYGDCRLNPQPVQTHGENDWCGSIREIKPEKVGRVSLREPAK